jgi:very-short-patch-repair endonuclease
MGEPFIGSAAVASGTLTRHTLRTKYVALHHDVYVARDAELTAVLRAKACWLRARGHGVLAGFSASAVHGARWIDATRPATIIDANRRRVDGISAWADAIDDDETCTVDGMRLTTPSRTAVDLARRHGVSTAVPAIDALARATRLKSADLERAALRHAGRRGMKQARGTLRLVDAGAQSPRESRLRLLLVRAEFPPVQTQWPVYNEYGALIAQVDMAWPELKIAIEYEGDHHRVNRNQFNKDIRRMDALIEQGWIVIRVTALDTEAVIIAKVAAARSRRT